MQTVKGTLKHGLKLGEQTLKAFELRAASTADMFAAEAIAGVDTPLKFNGALMTVQLVRIDDYTGPFTIEMIGKLKTADYAILRAAQLEVDRLGEA